MYKKWIIGEKVIDEDGHTGVVAIVWNDGDIYAVAQPPASITCPECGEPEPVMQCEKCGHNFNRSD